MKVGPPLRGGFKRQVSEAVMTVMGRRIPTTVPEISPEKASQLAAKLQPGDVILTCDCTFPGWARLEYWTVRSDYTHAAMYVGGGKVYEATGKGVHAEELSEYFQGRQKVALVRPPYVTPADAQAAADYCVSQDGKQYDGMGDLSNDEEIACTELVYNALKSTPNPIDTRVHSVLGVAAVGPDSFQQIPGARLLHDDHSDYWGNKLGHWPLAASGLALGMAGGLVGGIPGAACGLVAGVAGAILVGNKLQTGEFWPA